MTRAIKLSSVVAALFVALALGAAPAHAAGGKGAVKGKVVKSDGSPVADATVQLMARAPGGKAAVEPKAQNPADSAKAAKPARKERVKPESVAQTTTNAQGEFTLSDVAEGQYAVVARVKGEGLARQRVSVHAGQTANVSLTLKPRGEGPKAGANNNTTRAERKRARLQRKHEKAQQQQQQATVPQQ